MRVIYSNGTESNLLLRSLQRALYKDEDGRRITEPAAGPLFAQEDSSPFVGEADDEDISSGTIYVLRSKSDHPTVAAIPETLRYYIDWQAMARDAEMNGELFAVSTGWNATHVFAGC
ncbi:MAG: antirestriction protein ArdA [Sphingomonadaceae bacterium]